MRIVNKLCWLQINEKDLHLKSPKSISRQNLKGRQRESACVTIFKIGSRVFIVTLQRGKGFERVEFEFSLHNLKSRCCTVRGSSD